MAKLTVEMVKTIMPYAPTARIKAALPVLMMVALAYKITTARRIQAWLSALAIESGELKYQEEIASGAAYEGRRDLGNTQKGDGRRFKGRGRIQLTGRDVYEAYTEYLRNSKHLPFVDFVKEPEKLALEPYATDSAGWFVNGYKKLNGYADVGDLKTYHVRINGRNRKTGNPNQWTERQQYFRRGKAAIPTDWILTADDISGKLSAPAISKANEEHDYPNVDIPAAAESPNVEDPNGLDDDLIHVPASGEAGADPLPSAPNKTDVVIEKESEPVAEKPKGFLGALYTKVMAALGGGVTTNTAIEKAQQAQALGLSAETWRFIFWTVIVGLAIWVGYHFVVEKVLPWGRWIVGRIRTNQLIASNATADTVQVIEKSKLAEYEALGYTVVRRS
jgi:hypothetical protein